MRSALIVLLGVALVACGDDDTSSGTGTGASGASDPTSGPSSGGAPQGGAGGAGGTGADSTTNSASGGAPCASPMPETCNGADDDCDGVADEPPGDGMSGTACGCEWIVEAGRHYARCTIAAPATPEDSCPMGTSAFAAADDVELQAIAALVPADSRLRVGLTQSTSTGVSGAWAWSQIGAPFPWAAGQPDDDAAGNKPVPIETGLEQCGVVTRQGGGPVELHDANCAVPTEILCEDVASCTAGTACLGDLGCPGTTQCGGGVTTCAAAPVLDECNGYDDNCDGVVDSSNNVQRCLCMPIDANAQYMRCFATQLIGDAHCPAGYGLAKITSGGESNGIKDLLTSNWYWTGLYQRAGAGSLGGGWFYTDETAASAPWYAGAPNDDDGVEELTEDGDENCGSFLKAESSIFGMDDLPCDEERPYICELLP